MCIQAASVNHARAALHRSSSIKSDRFFMIQINFRILIIRMQAESRPTGRVRLPGDRKAILKVHAYELDAFEWLLLNG